MNKVKNYLLKKYENQDIFYKRKSQYILLITLLLFLHVFLGGVIELILGFDTITESLIVVSSVLLIGLFIKLGNLEIATNLMGVMGLARGVQLLFFQNGEVHFYLHIVLILIAIAVSQVKKYQTYLTMGWISVLFIIKQSMIFNLARQSNEFKNVVLNLSYVMMIFIFILMVTEFIVRIINLEIEESREIKIQNKKLEESNKFKIDFIANISHELRTPLNGIIGNAELMSFNKKSGGVRKEISNILQLSKHLLTLINQLINLAKVENEKVKIENSEFSLKELLKEVSEIFNSETLSKKILFFKYVSVKIPDKLFGDYLKLKQVLINIVGNAVKFTEKGAILLNIELLERNTGSVKVRFYIEDSGIGMDAEDLKRIFHSFEQGKIDLSKKYQGTGLGLAISQGFINLMDSEIFVKSKKGKGSSFWFDLILDTYSEVNNVETREKDFLVLSANDYIINYYSKYFSDYDIEYFIAEDAEELEMYIDDNNIEDSVVFLSEEFYEKYKTKLEFEKIFKEVYFIPQSLGESLLFKNVIGFEPEELESIIVSEKDSYIDEESNQTFLTFDGVKALIVEDNMINTEIMIDYLKYMNIKSDSAKNAEECIEKINKTIYDIIFLDIQLPDIDGFKLLHMIKENVKRKPVIVAFTASVMKKFKDKCLKFGFDDFISKPFMLEDVSEVLVRNLKEYMRAIKKNDFESQSISMEIIKILIEEYPIKIKEMKKSIKNFEYDKVQKISHNLKSGAAVTGNIKLYTILKEIEEYSIIENKAKVEALIHRSQLELDRIVREEGKVENINY